MANRRLEYIVGLNADTTQFQQALTNALTKLKALGGQPQITESLQKASNAAMELERHLTRAFNADTGKLDLKLLNDNLTKSGKTLSQYAKQLYSLGPEGEEAFLQVANAITKTELPLRRSNKLLNELWVTMKNTMRWQLTSSMLHGFVGSIQTAYGYSKDLNESLNNIRIVTGKSTEDMSNFAKQANKAAKELNTLTTRYTDASLIYYQQGLSDTEVTERTETTVKLANVSRQAAEDVSDQMTAIWNNFDNGSKSLEYYADVITALGATTASSSQEIAGGLEKFAAAAETTGLSYEYSAAALATIVAATRLGEDTVGTGLRTILGRLESLQMGETLEDGVTFTKYTKALEAAGVSVLDTNGQLKKADEILDSIAEKWQTMSATQQQSLAYTVGGVRQYTTLLALFNNWDKMTKNVATARGAEGTLQQQADIYAESWEAARNNVRAAAEDIYDSLINPDFYIGVDKIISPLLEGTADVIDSMGGLKGILITVSTLMTKVYGDKIAQSMRDMATSLGFITGQEQLRARLLQQEAVSLLREQKIAQSEYKSQDIGLQLKDVEIRQQANLEMDRLTEYQATILQNDLEHLDVLEKQASYYLQNADAAERQYNSSKSIISNTKSTKDWDIPIEDIGKRNQDKIIDLIGDKDIKTSQQAIKVLLPELDKLIIKANNIEKLKQGFSNLDKTISQETRPELEKLAKELGLVQDQNETTEEYIERLEKEFRTITLDANDFKKALIGLNVDPKELEKYSQAIRDLQDNSLGASRAVDNLSKEQEELLSNLQNHSYATKDLADTIVTVGQALGQLIMLWQGFQNLGRVFTDEDMTAGERFISIFTSLSMMLPATISLINLLTGAKNKENVATAIAAMLQGKENTVESASLVTKLAAVLARKVLAKNIDAETFSTNINTVSHIANNAALLAGVAIIAGVVAGVALLAGGIWLLVKAYNADADAAKKAWQQAEQLNETYKEMKSTYDELKQSIEDYDDSLKALDELAKGTEEYASALEKANENALELISKNPELQSQAYRDTSGAIRFRDTTLEDLQTQAEQQVSTAQIASIIGRVKAQEAQLKADITTLNRQLKGQQNIPTSGATAYAAGAQYQQQEAVKGALTNDKINAIIEAIRENGNNALIEEDLQNLNIELSDSSKKIILDNMDALIDVAKSADNLSDSIKFQQIETARAYLQGNSDIYQQQDIAIQTALDAMVGRIEFEDIDVAITDAQKWYQEKFGYGGFKGKSGETVFLDEFGKEVAFVDNEIMKQFYAREKQLESVTEETIQNFIVSAEKLRTVGKNFNIQGLGNELLGFIGNDKNIDILNELTYEQVKNLRENLSGAIADAGIEDWKSLGYDSAEAYIKALEENLDKWDINSYFDNLTQKYSSAMSSALEALDLLQSGGKIEEKLYTQLANQYGDIFDFDILGDLANQSTYDQVFSLTEVLLALPKKLEEAQTKANDMVKKQILDLKEEKKVAEGLRKKYELNIEEWTKQSNKIDEIQKKIEKLSKEDFQVTIKIDTDDIAIKGALGKLKQLSEASKLIDENYTVTSENISKLVQILPEALDDAIADFEAGTVQLNKATLEAIKADALNVRLSTQETLMGALEDRVNAAQAELNAVQWFKANAIDEYGQITKRREELNGEELKSYNLASQQILIQSLKEKRDRLIDAQKTAEGKTDAEEYSAKASAHYANQTSISYGKAYDEIKDNAYKAFQNIEKMSEALADPDKTVEGVYDKSRSVSAGQYQVQSYEELIEHKTNLEDSYFNSQINAINNLIAELESGDFSRLEKLLREGDKRRMSDEDRAALSFLRSQLSTDQQQAIISGDYLGGVTATVDGKTGIEYVTKDENGNWVTKIGTYLPDQLIGDLRYKLAQAYEDALTAGGYINAFDNASKGKGSKSSLSKKGEKPEDKEDRYHNINKELEYYERLLDKIDAKSDRVYGIDRLDKYDEKLKVLAEQTESLEKKKAEALQYLTDDKNDVIAQLAAQGFEVQFNNITGNIDNYEELLKGLTTKYKAAYDALPEEMTEQQKKDWDEITDNYKKALKAMEQYENTVEVANETVKNIKENLEAIADTKLEKLSYKFELILDVKNAKDQVTSLAKTISESFSDALTHSTSVGNLNLDQAIRDSEYAYDLMDKYAELQQLQAEATSATDFKALNEAYQDLQGEIVSTAESLIEFCENLESVVPDAVSAASERFSQFTNQLSHNTSILDSLKELYELQGVTYKTQQGFDALTKVAQTKMDTALASAKLNRAEFETMEGLLRQAQADLDSLNGDENDSRYDLYKQRRDAYLDEYNTLQEAMYSSAVEAMQALTDMYSLSLERAKDIYDKAISGGLGLDYMQDKFDRYINGEQQYLDKVNEAYQVASWYNKLQADIDDSTNAAYKNRLKALKDEIDARKEGNTLSEYDLDILEAKYNLLQAEMALEDARNAKSEMRLVRDRQGNWNYQFTANPDEITKAEQGVLDAQNEYYNIAKNQTKDLANEIIQTKKDFGDAITDLYNDTTLTTEERNAKIVEIQDYYNQRMKYLYDEMGIAVNDMTQAGIESIGKFENSYAEDLEDMTGSMEEWQYASQELLAQSETDWNNYKSTMNTVAKETGTDMDTLKEKTQDVANATQKVYEQGDIAIQHISNQLYTIDEAVTRWENYAKQVQDTVTALQEYNTLTANQIKANSGIITNEDIDYSAQIAKMFSQGEDVSSLLRQRQNKLNALPGNNYMTNDELMALLKRLNTINETVADRDWFNYALSIAGFDTGGYTGEFSDAKLAFLHQKELVLNQEDTANILTAVSAIRSIGPGLFEQIEKVLDGNAMAAMALMGQNVSTTQVAAVGPGTLEQLVRIEHVEFPNATSGDEIKEALVGLVNDAAQWAQRKTE